MPPEVAPVVQTPTPVSPVSSSGPLSSAGSSTPRVSWPELIKHAFSTILAIFTATKVLSWFPACLDMVRLPTGGVSHDVWAWAPLVLDLGAAVAVAAPVSFRSVTDLVKALWTRRAAD
jgi:hypothetical protein